MVKGKCPRCNRGGGHVIFCYHNRVTKGCYIKCDFCGSRTEIMTAYHDDDAKEIAIEEWIKGNVR